MEHRGIICRTGDGQSGREAPERLADDRHSRFFEEGPGANYISSPDDRLLACNAAFARMLGFPSIQDALKADPRSLHPGSLGRHEVLNLLRKNGTVDLTHQEWRTRDGEPLRVFETARAEFDDAGRMVQIRGTLLPCEDHDGQSDSQSRRFEAIGRLTTGLAHDLNDLFTGIADNAERLLSLFPEGDSLRSTVEMLKEANERSASLILPLLNFSRKQAALAPALDLHDTVLRMEERLRAMAGPDVELGIFTTDEPGLARIDRDQAERVILHLADNALEAMPRGGKLVIESNNVDLDGASSHRSHALASGPYVMLSLKDTGAGMDKATQARILEPFFTTKEGDGVRGLGLPAVYGIVRQMGGGIFFESEPRNGATFSVYLPRVKGKEMTSQPGVSGKSPGTTTVLLVEDDEMVRAIISDSLCAQGYAIIEASQGEEALLLCQDLNTSIDVLVTDMMMPGMNGLELARRLTEIHPKTKVLFMSGYADAGIARDDAFSRTALFLQKPFRLELLNQKLREVLDDDH